MRRQLILVFGSISLMVALAFVVPLAVLVRSTAEDRAIDAARADAAAIVPSLVSGGARNQLESAVGATDSGRDGRMTVITSSGWTIGPEVPPSSRSFEALELGASAIGSIEGGVEVVTAVASAPGELSAIRVFVPTADLRRGQRKAWTALALVAVTLVGLAIIVADRLARSIVRPAQELASAARRLGDGDLETRVEPSGPPELEELSTAFNTLGAEVSSMLARERELVAELSHRLRTPLTTLRMRVEQVTDDRLVDELRADVDGVTRAVNDLINEARNTLGPRDAGHAPDSCEVRAVVADRVEFWSVLAEDQERPWSFDRGITTARVALTSSSLAAAIDVLIENVFSHTTEGTEFAVGIQNIDESVRVWVGDAGHGLTAAATPRGVSASGSTGLGLDIARSTAESVGGSLEIGTSELGGAEIALVLPVIDP